METIMNGFNAVASSNVDWSLTAGPIWLLGLAVAYVICGVIMAFTSPR